MKRIRSSLRQIVVSFFLIYLAGLMLATDGCTRLERTAWPSTYGWQGLLWAADPWLAPEQRAQLTQWRVAGDQRIDTFLQQPELQGAFLCAR